ncbi:hypothetical protein RND81_08G107100 [Saponaria officinalis]|uniref:Uncharacterized protein n=1 Tax=Saponaria officinalis TaxID=3572 RepID=A0AAW1J6Y0_SAPOF
MAYMQRPQETTYYESKTEIIREPYDSYSSEYPHQRQQHHGVGGVLGEVVGAIVEKIVPGSHGHNHNHHGEVIERREERIYENGCDPCRRVY